MSEMYEQYNKYVVEQKNKKEESLSYKDWLEAEFVLCLDAINKQKKDEEFKTELNYFLDKMAEKHIYLTQIPDGLISDIYDRILDEGDVERVIEQFLKENR